MRTSREPDGHGGVRIDQYELTGEPMSDTEWNRLLSPVLGDVELAIKELSRLDEVKETLLKEVAASISKFVESFNKSRKIIAGAERELVSIINKVYKKGQTKVDPDDWDSLCELHGCFYVIADHTGLGGDADELKESIKEIKNTLGGMEPDEAIKELKSMGPIANNRSSENEHDFEPRERVF